jgi:GntR family transcriptional regulator
LVSLPLPGPGSADALAFSRAWTWGFNIEPTMGDRRAEILDVLRRRVLRGLHAGALRAGDRLPSARELKAEFGADQRIVLAAYRELVDEGLVELRPRGGIYVAAARGGAGALPLPSETWLVDILAQAVAREIPLTEIHEWLRRAVETLRLRAAVIQATPDQIAGMCRELEDDYGLSADGVDVASISEDGDPPVEIRYADVLVTTQAYAALARQIASRLRKELIVTDVRPDLIGGEWRMLLRKPVYVVASDSRFVDLLRGYFATTPGAQNLRFLIVGRDDLGAIPDDAPTYVTRSARDRLGGVQIRGRILPSARVFSAETGREIIRLIVRRNLDVLAGRPRADRSG